MISSVLTLGMYVDERTFDERQNEASRMLSKHPDRVPLVVERAPNCKLPQIDRRKWLVPREITCGQWITILRRRISLTSRQGLFLLVNNVMPITSHTMGQIYDDHKDASGLLMMTYTVESTFG